MECTFQVGQKVVCISDDFGIGHYGETTPRLNGIYTIREVLIGPKSGKPCVRLKEIVNKTQLYREGRDECIWRADRFRPVRTIDTTNEVAALKKLVSDVMQKVRA